MTRSGLVAAVAAAWLLVATPKAAEGLIIPNGYPDPQSECLFPTEHVQETFMMTPIYPPGKPRRVGYERKSTCFVKKETYSIVVKPGDTLTKIADVFDYYMHVTPQNLARRNGIANPNHIEQGMTISVSESYDVRPR